MIIPVLMYHSVSNDNSNLSIDLKSFEKQLKYLANEKFKTINFEEIDSSSKNSIIITFDDGYKDILINALPLLNKYNFKATCFIVSSLVGQSNLWDRNKNNFIKKELMTSNDINEWINNGMLIGSHSRTHKNLTKIDVLELDKEIINSKDELENLCGNKIESFSYPYGKLNKKIYEKVKVKYNYAVTTVRSRFNTLKHKKCYVPRIHMSNNLSKIKLFFKFKTFYEDIKYNEKSIYM